MADSLTPGNESIEMDCMALASLHTPHTPTGPNCPPLLVGKTIIQRNCPQVVFFHYGIMHLTKQPLSTILSIERGVKDGFGSSRTTQRRTSPRIPGNHPL